MYIIYLCGLCFFWGLQVGDSCDIWGKWSFWDRVEEMVICLVVSVFWPVLMALFIICKLFDKPIARKILHGWDNED